LYIKKRITVVVIILGLQGIAVQRSVFAAASSDMSNNVATDDSKNIQNDEVIM
jgi:hypothetical protein